MPPEARQLQTTRNNTIGELYNKMARDLALKNLAEVTQQQYLRWWSSTNEMADGRGKLR